MFPTITIVQIAQPLRQRRPLLCWLPLSRHTLTLEHFDKPKHLKHLWPADWPSHCTLTCTICHMCTGNTSLQMETHIDTHMYAHTQYTDFRYRYPTTQRAHAVIHLTQVKGRFFKVLQQEHEIQSHANIRGNLCVSHVAKCGCRLHITCGHKEFVKLKFVSDYILFLHFLFF